MDPMGFASLDPTETFSETVRKAIGSSSRVATNGNAMRTARAGDSVDLETYQHHRLDGGVYNKV